MEVDTVADVFLVVLPLRILWRVTLPENERRFVFLLFSGSLVTLCSVAVTTIFTAGPFVPLAEAGLVIFMTSRFMVRISFRFVRLFILTNCYCFTDNDFD